MNLSNKSVLAALLAVASIPGYNALATRAVADAGAAGRARYQITIINVTRGQILSPTVIAAHTSRMNPLFELGKPAAPEVRMVAEDAVNQPLIDAFNASPEVGAVAVLTGAGGPIMPGETASVTLDCNPRVFDKISLMGMLVTTNDAFYALNGEDLPNRGKVTYRSAAYDAGTEANNEKCAYIPGPPCNNMLVRQPQGAEGYVHIHAGIHGIGDLDPAIFDWRGDVAVIRIRRLH